MPDLRTSGSGMYSQGPGRPPMLPARRFRCWLPFVALFSLAVSLSLPLQAQVPAMEFHGVPSSGIGGTSTAFSAVRPSANVPGYGAAAFGCCASFFFPSSFSPMVPYSPVATGHQEHRRRHRRNREVVGVAEPVYIPYAVPYAVDSDEPADDADDAEPAGAALGDVTPERLSGSRAGKPGSRQFTATGVPEDAEQKAIGDSTGDSGDDAGSDSAAEVTPQSPDVPVVAQPTTVLVFKDGHRSEIVNYAIV